MNPNVKVIEAARDAFPKDHYMYGALDHAAAELAVLHLRCQRAGLIPSIDEVLSESEREVALAQAVELADYVERQAKGSMRDAAKRFLSLPYAQRLAQWLTVPEDFVLVPIASVEPCGCGCHRYCCGQCGAELGGSKPRTAPLKADGCEESE